MTRQHQTKRRLRMVEQRHAPGTAPGTIAAPSDATDTQIRVIEYNVDGVTESHPLSIAKLRSAHESGGKVTWIDVVGLREVKRLREIGDLFGLHPLAMEDVVHVHQRPKVEVYGDHLFAVVRLPDPDEDLGVEQISMFLGVGWVLTFQERAGDCFEPVRERIRSNRGRVRSTGADYLCYCLLDAAVDHYFPVLARFEDRLTKIEGRVLQHAAGDTVAELTQIKRELNALRRSIAPLRDALTTLANGVVQGFAEDTLPYLWDCRDHADQLLDLVDALREEGKAQVDLHLSMASQRLNDVMKVLTIIATLFMPLGFIAGLYGMNFDPDKSPWNMPELRWAYGYPMALGLMLVTAAGLLWFFRRKGWLGGSAVE